MSIQLMKKNKEGDTALHVALKQGNAEAAAALIYACPKLAYVPDKHGHPAMRGYAIQLNNEIYAVATAHWSALDVQHHIDRQVAGILSRSSQCVIKVAEETSAAADQSPKQSPKRTTCVLRCVSAVAVAALAVACNMWFRL